MFLEFDDELGIVTTFYCYGICFKRSQGFTGRAGIFNESFSVDWVKLSAFVYPVESLLASMLTENIDCKLNIMNISKQKYNSLGL